MRVAKFTESIINIDFNNVKKLANFVNPNYALLREALEIINKAEFACNDRLHAKIQTRWRSLLKEKAKVK